MIAGTEAAPAAGRDDVKPCRHRRVWLFGANLVTGLIWCYECGAIRHRKGDKWLRWVKPVGKGGENPANYRGTT